MFSFSSSTKNFRNAEYTSLCVTKTAYGAQLKTWAAKVDSVSVFKIQGLIHDSSTYLILKADLPKLGNLPKYGTFPLTWFTVPQQINVRL